METISILGCGWLGLPLAAELVKNRKKVKGSTTTLDKIPLLKEVGLQPYHIKLTPDFEGENSFFDSETLIINIPPKVKFFGEDFHLAQLQNLLNICKTIDALKKILFVSSTSVYPNIEKEMVEEDAELTHFLVKSENLIIDFCKKNKKQFLILRFGGLMGYDRNPCKYFSEKTSTDNSRVNYIHRDDAVGAIISLLNEGIANEILNIVSPQHPSRSEIWANCTENPHARLVKSRESTKKIINSEKLSSISTFQFQFPDPLAFKYL